ncbi:MAG: hypothetical protein HYY76_05745 [Acidobacteria bacterium]|nr:hypothetical protein [Acidobacteriota bacterium]
MLRRSVVATAVLLVLATPPALAHDGHAHLIMGTVTARGDKDVKVKTPSGEVLTIAITEKTAVLRGKQKVKVAQVEVGRRVVVDIGNGEDPLIAREIRVGATRLDEKEK